MVFDKFAEELKTAREQKGLTLQQVAQKTKIDYKFLEVMEEGDFSFLPELYVKAFLKNYARVIGLDENVVIMKYEAAKTGKVFTEEEQPVQDNKPVEEPKKESHSAPVKTPRPVASKSPSMNISSFQGKQKIFLTAAGVIILLLVAGYFFFSRSDSDIIVTEKPLDEIVQENKERYIEEKPEPVRTDSTMISSDSLYLNIASTETSWVKIMYDDKSTSEFILFPQAQKNVKASDNFKITFGNSKGIKLKLNGSDLTFTSKGNVVSRIMIDSTGLHYLTPQKDL